jgi:hypothetical protein
MVERMSWENQANLSPGASLGRRLIALVIDWTMCRLVAALLSPAVIPDSTFSTLIILRIKVLTYPDQQRVTAGKVALRTLLICLVFPAIFTNNGRPIHDFVTRSQTVRQL